MIRTYDPKQWPLFVKASRHIRKAGTVLDIGSGIRPQCIVPCEKMICFEAHDEYLAQLQQYGFDTFAGVAPRDLTRVESPIDTVTMIDVIEHMEREDGIETIRLALEIAQRQVIVFTPLGFMKQDQDGSTDAWGMQGQYWQRHRSGWKPEDFPGWLCLTDPRFHAHAGHGAFFAIWTKP